MIHSEGKNEVRLQKIPIAVLIETLQEFYDNGLEYVDIIGVPGQDQDVIGLAFTEEYMMKEEDMLEEEELEDDNINPDLSDEDLNQLL
jgi:hypothetical protein